MITDAMTAGRTATHHTAHSAKQEKAGNHTTKPNAAQAADSVEISDEARKQAERSAAGKKAAVTGVKTENTSASATRQWKDAEAERYDNILNELRGTYGEEEAMNRFNEIMRAEGFEVQETISDPTKTNFHNTTSSGVKARLGPVSASYIARRMAAAGKAEMPQSSPPSYDYSSNYYTYATVVGNQDANGTITHDSGTYAVYNAFDWDNYSDTLESYKNRNLDALTEESGIDMKEYTKNLTSEFADQFAAESVNADLAKVVKSILNQTGFTLGKGQEVSFTLKNDDRGGYNGLTASLNFEDEALLNKIQSAVDDAVAKDGSILASFLAEDERAGLFDVESLSEHFKNGTQSLQFRQARHFVLSGDDPSVMVTGSKLYAQAKGYTYQKKLSDSFDYGADDFIFRAGARTGYTFGELDVHMANLGAAMFPNNKTT